MSSGAQTLCDMGCEPGLEFLENMSQAEKLTLKQLTLKLVTLAALLQLEVHLCIKWICVSDSLSQMGYFLRSLS